MNESIRTPTDLFGTGIASDYWSTLNTLGIRAREKRRNQFIRDNQQNLSSTDIPQWLKKSQEWINSNYKWIAPVAAGLAGIAGAIIPSHIHHTALAADTGNIQSGVDQNVQLPTTRIVPVYCNNIYLPFITQTGAGSSPQPNIDNSPIITTTTVISESTATWGDGFGLFDPSGISSDGLITDPERDESPYPQNADPSKTINADSVDLQTGQPITGVTTLNFSNEPTGVDFNPTDGTYWLSNDNNQRVENVRKNADGTFSLIRKVPVSPAEIDPEDVTVLSDDELVLTGGLGVYKWNGGNNHTLEGLCIQGSDDTMQKYSVASLDKEANDPEGYDTNNGKDYIVSNGDVVSHYIFVTEPDGKGNMVLVQRLDISQLNCRSAAAVRVLDSGDIGLTCRGYDNTHTPLIKDGTFAVVHPNYPPATKTSSKP